MSYADELRSQAADAVEVLLADCLEREPVERVRALRDACSTHPELAADLRARWSALVAMGVIDGDERADQADFPEQLGEFKLLERIGGGGMGVVYLARQTSLGREVALKLVRPEHLYFPRAKERFRREAEAVAKLAHPGIVPIYTVGEEQGIPFFAMERVRGCTLAEALEKLSGRAPESLTGRDMHALVCDAAGAPRALADDSIFGQNWVELCLTLARQVADALAHAHAQGVLHRDVKPSNIMLTPDGRALLLDFGLTAAIDQGGATRTGAQVGTLFYMSPEQVRAAERVDARTDVYGLGVTLYEMLSLQLPYRGGDALETQRLILAGRPDSIRARNRRVHADAEIVCNVAIDVDPARRYASAPALARDLFNLLEHRPIAARPPGAMLRARRWAQRRPATTTAIVLGTLLIVGTPIALYVQQLSHVRELRSTISDQTREAAFLFDLFAKAAPSAPDKPLSVEDVVARGERSVDIDFADRPWLAARTRTFLGRVYHQLRLPNKAVPLFESAIATAEDPRTPDLYRHPNETALYLAESLIALGEYERAAQLAERSAAFYRETYPDRVDRIRYADTLVAATWIGMGRVDQGVALTERLLEVTREAAGADSEEFARALCNLAAAYSARGDLAHAEELWKHALPVLRDALGPAHPDLVSLLSNIGLALKKRARLDEAAPFYEEALAMVRVLWRNPNATAGGMLLNYATFEEARGHYDVAEKIYHEAAEMLAVATGPEAYATVIARGNLAGMLARHGRCSDAEALYLEVLPLQERALKGNDPIVGFSLSNLAKCAAARGDRDAAREYLHRAIDRWHACANSDEWIAGAEKHLEELDSN